MKNLIFFVTISFCVLLACGKEEPIPICGDSAIVGPLCDCPEETHIQLPLESGSKRCYPKGEGRYYSTLTGNYCFNKGKFEKRVDTGTVRFQFEDFHVISMFFDGDNAYMSNNFTCGVQNTVITDQADGSKSITFEYYQCGLTYNCLDWAERSPDCVPHYPGVVGYGSGASNTDVSSWDIEIEWKDCNGVVLDVANIHAWR